jgi:TRAP-type C4-dicarboxylate transport system substrate-binding protein
MRMTRRSIAAAAGAAVLPLLLPGRPAAAQARWQLATASPAEAVTTRNLRQFVQDAREASGNWLDIRLHADGNLLKQSGLRQGVQVGEVQMAEILLSAEAGLDPFFDLDAIPRLVQDYGQARRLAELSRPMIERRLQREGLTLLYMMATPPGGLFTGFAIDSLAMLRGTRMRARTPMGARLATLLGATPAPLEPEEVEEGFATRVASTMFASASTGVDVRAWTFARFFTALDTSFPKGAVVAQTRALEAMPAASRAALRDAAAAAEARGWELSAAARAEAPLRLAENGMELRQPTPPMVAELQRVSELMLEEWLARAGEPGRRLIDAYRSG